MPRALPSAPIVTIAAISAAGIASLANADTAANAMLGVAVAAMAAWMVATEELGLTADTKQRLRNLLDAIDGLWWRRF